MEQQINCITQIWTADLKHFCSWRIKDCNKTVTLFKRCLKKKEVRQVLNRPKSQGKTARIFFS